MTEHRATIYMRGLALPHARGLTRRDSSLAQYGERVRAAAVYLNAQQLVREERTARVLADLFGARACGASVAGW